MQNSEACTSFQTSQLYEPTINSEAVFMSTPVPMKGADSQSVHDEEMSAQNLSMPRTPLQEQQSPVGRLELSAVLENQIASGIKSTSDSSGIKGQRVFEQIEHLDLKKKKLILLWIRIFFFMKTLALFQHGSMMRQWKLIGQIIVSLYFCSYLASSFCMVNIFIRKKDKFILYEFIFSCISVFLLVSFFELGPDTMAHEGTRAYEVSTTLQETKILLFLVILQIVIASTIYIETERQRKIFFSVLCGCFLMCYGFPFIRYLNTLSSVSLKYLLSNLVFFVLVGLITTGFTYILFSLVSVSQLLFLLEKDQTNRYRYMFNSIKDFILVEHSGQVLFKNRLATNMLKSFEGSSSARRGGGASIDDEPEEANNKEASSEEGLQHPWLYIFEDFKESGSQNSRGRLDQSRCYSISDLLKMEFEAVASLVFTTEKEIAESKSLDNFQDIIRKLGEQEDSAAVPVFVQVKLFCVQKEVIEDLMEEGDEVMVQIQDVSHRVLGQSLKIERQYQTIMNSTVSHEMRNPLNALLSSVEAQQRKISELAVFLNSEGLDKAGSDMIANFRKSLGISQSSCKLLKFNVEDILALPQIQQGKFTKSIAQVDIKGAIDEIVEIMEFQAQEKGIAVNVSLEGFSVEEVRARPRRLAMDEQRFQQILLNYLSNAIKFTKNSGRIQITLTFVPNGHSAPSIPVLEASPPQRPAYMQDSSSDSDRSYSSGSPREDQPSAAQPPDYRDLSLLYEATDSDKIILAVIDDGISIKPCDQRKLFKLFGCLKTSKQINTKGVGLGLAISKMIAEEFGGSVAVQSRAQVGSAFYASMAVNQPACEIGSEVAQEQEALVRRLQAIQAHQLKKVRATLEALARGDQEPAQGKKVLFIDDEAYNLEVLVVILEALGLDRSRFDACLSGEEALRKVRENSAPGKCAYALVLTDLSMPQMNGFKFTRKMRRLLEQAYGLPLEAQPLVAAITGHTESEFFLHAFENKIDQVYSKPISSETVQLLLTEAGFAIGMSEHLEEKVRGGK